MTFATTANAVEKPNPWRRALSLSVAFVLIGTAIGWIAPRAHAVAQTYGYTGGPQIYVVPPGVTSINVTLSGAQGNPASGSAVGGLGGSVSATIAVTPGEVLQVMVGGSGTSGGFNGGGNGSGVGGGASDIRRPAFSTQSSCAYNLTCTYANRIIVAGGGGGAGNFASSAGGNGGQTATAGASGGIGDATGGGAATASAGGAAGSGTYSTSGSGAAAGASGTGGASAWVAGATGGGGGGGYFGGGGGGVSQDNGGTPQADGSGGGGGGTSWAGGSGVTAASFVDGTRTGDGVVTIDPPSAITNAAFGFTGSSQHYAVASDVSELAVRIYGGAGLGTQGDIVTGRLPVTAGEVLEINIAGRGLGYTLGASGWTGGAGGWNGGGEGVRGSFQSWGGGGGGATDIRRCAGAPASACSLVSRLVVAGGGGGTGEPSWGCYGGAGGTGSTGGGGTGGCSTFGTGASLTQGGVGGAGAAGAGGRTSTDGASGIGGRGGSTGALAGGGAGGGGGGYFGGGGGFDNGGGGGGSSFASVTGADATGQGVGNVLGQSGAAFTHAQGNGGDGMAVITAMPIGVTSPATGVTRTQADISGTVNPKYLATTPTVQYSTSQSTVAAGGGTSANLTGPSSASVLAGDSVQAVSGSISGLSASTTYYFRVCAQSVAGNGCGSISSFTTLPVGFTPPVVTTTSATATDATSATASATLNPGTGPTTIVFQCSTSSTFASIDATGTAAESPMSGVSSQSATGACAGLTAATTYYVRVVASVTVSGNTYTYPASAATITTTAAPTPSPSGGGSSSTPAATPAPSPTVLPPLVPVTPSAPAAVTGPVLLVNGQPQSVTVVPTSRDEGLSITGPDFSMTIEGVGASGVPLGLTSDGALILENDRFARTTGTGFLADSPVKLYLFSDPLYVGDVLTNARGVFNGSVQIPLTVGPGRHTLQANGYTASGEVRSLSLPVVVQDNSTAATTSATSRHANASVLFAALSDRLTPSARATLSRLVKRVGSSAKVTQVTGFVQDSGSSVNDVQLSTRRARAVTRYLRGHGMRGQVIVRGEGPSAFSGAAARRVNVKVTYSSARG